MKESIGGALMLRIFLVIIVLFVVFLCLSANYAKVFRVKNGIINIIEQYQGINPTSIKLIERYISDNGYSCMTSEYSDPVHYILKDNSGILYGEYEGRDSSNKFFYIDGNDTDEHSELKDRKYNIQVCIDWNMPIIYSYGKWTIHGKTEIIDDAIYS